MAVTNISLDFWLILDAWTSQANFLIISFNSEMCLLRFVINLTSNNNKLKYIFSLL